MSRALWCEIAELLSTVGTLSLRVAELMRSEAGHATAPAENGNDVTRARAARALRSLGEALPGDRAISELCAVDPFGEETPEEAEVLKRLRKGKPKRRDET